MGRMTWRKGGSDKLAPTIVLLKNFCELSKIMNHHLLCFLSKMEVSQELGVMGWSLRAILDNFRRNNQRVGGGVVSSGETCFYECARTDGFNYRSKPKLFLLNLMMSLLLAAVSKEIDYKFQRQPEFLLWMFECQPEFCLTYYKKNF